MSHPPLFFLKTHDQFPDLVHLSTLQTSVEAGKSNWGVYPAGTAAKGPNLSMDGLSRSGKTTLLSQRKMIMCLDFVIIFFEIGKIILVCIPL